MWDDEAAKRACRASCAFFLGRQPSSAILVDDQPVVGQLDKRASSRAATIESRCRSNSASKSLLVMLPVATISSRRGVERSRWLSRKSRSLVTTTRSSASVCALMSASVVRFP